MEGSCQEFWLFFKVFGTVWRFNQKVKPCQSNETYDAADSFEYLLHLGYIILLIPWDIPHHFRKCPSKQKRSAKLQNHLMDTWWWNLDRTLIYRGVNDLTFMLIILFVYCTLGQSHFFLCHMKFTLNHCGNYLPFC